MNEELPPNEVGEESLEDAISSRARQKWESEGRPDGEHERHWLEAESEILAERALNPPGKV